MAHELGYYVHARLMNYRKYGITKKQEGSEGFTSAMMKQKQKILQQAKMSTQSESIVQEYQDLLNFFLGDNSKGNKFFGKEWTESEKQQIQNSVVSGVQSEFGTNAFIDYNRLYGEILSGSFHNTEIRVTEQMKKGIKLGKNYQVGQGARVPKDALKRRLSTLIQGVNQLPNTADNMQIITKALQLRTQWRVIKKDMSLGQGKYVDTSKYANFITDLNNSFKEWKMNTSTAIRGKLLEGFLSIAAGLTEKALGLQINNTLAEGFTPIKTLGSQKKQNALLSTNITTQIPFNKVIANSNYSIAYEDPATGLKIAATENLTSQKVDAVITLPVLNIPIGINAKNFNRFTFEDISVLSGKSLLVLLQDESVFANHYMNIMASHETVGDVGANGINRERVLAQEIMKLTALSYAIKGGVTTLNGNNHHEATAGLFITNDMSGIGRIRIHTIDEILNIAFNNIELIKINLTTSCGV